MYLKFKMPPGWFLACLTVSLGMFANGYDTGSIGALTTMPQFAATYGELTPTTHGLVISTISLTGGIPGFFAGHLADKYGSLILISTGASIFLIGCILEASSLSLAQLIAGRAIAGLGQGLLLSNISVYICEIAPSANRGVMGGMAQLLVTIGLCAGFFTCYGTTHIDSSVSFRLPFIIQAVTSFALALSCFFLPSSPRWLYLNGRHDEALHAVDTLHITRAEAEKDIFRPLPIGRNPAPKSGFLFIFRKEWRTRTLFALFLMAMVQFSGIDGVLYYAPLLFTQAGLSSQTASFFASGVSALLIFLVSIPAFLLADKWGRRTSFIIGGLGMAGCMFVMGSLYETGSVHASTGVGRWVVIVLIFIFALLYAATWAISSKVYASEIQAPLTRAAANSLAQGINFFTNWLVSLFTPIFLARSSYGAYFLFGSFTLFTTVVCFLYMPETKGKSLEAIQEGFHAPGLQALATLGRKTVQGTRWDLGKPSTVPRENIELDRMNAPEVPVPNAS